MRVYLLDIVEAIDKALLFARGLTVDELAADDLRRDAVLRCDVLQNKMPALRTEIERMPLDDSRSG